LMRPDGDGHYGATVTAPPGVWRITVTTVSEHLPTAIEELLLVTDP